MRLRTRLIAVASAPVLLAGFMLAGSAGSSPVLGGSQLAKVTFSAVVITGTNTVTLDSTACTVTEGGKTETCFLSGSGGLNNQGNLATANIAITDSFGPITLSLSGLHSPCGVGTGVAVPAKGSPEPVVATIVGPVNPSAGGIVSGTLKIFGSGDKVVGCQSTSTSTTTTSTTIGQST